MYPDTLGDEDTSKAPLLFRPCITKKLDTETGITEKEKIAFSPPP